jgi:hypothetical protein
MFSVLVCGIIGSIQVSFINSDLYGLDANNTLTSEELNEIEKNPEQIIDSCDARIDSKLDPGKLCDAYFVYLDGKCDRLDYLTAYCHKFVMPNTKRSIQRDCNISPPKSNDLKRFKICAQYVNLKSVPLTLSLKGVHFAEIVNRSDTLHTYKVIETTFSVSNPNSDPVKLISISYIVSKDGIKLVSGAVGDLAPNPYLCSTCNLEIASGETNEFSDKQIISSHEAVNVVSNSSYVINGNYRYENSSSGIESKQFNFTGR